MKKYLLTIVISQICICLVSAQNQSKISGQILSPPKDFLKIILRINSITSETKVFSVPIVDGKFEKELEITKPTYVQISDGKNNINGLIEPKDKIIIRYDANNLSTSLNFNGKGSKKFSFTKDYIQFKFHNKIKDQIPIIKQQKHPFDAMQNFIDQSAAPFFKQLNLMRPEISRESFNILNAALKTNLMLNKERGITMIYQEGIDEILAKRKSELTIKSKKYLQNILQFDNALFYSFEYLEAVYTMLFKHYDGLSASNKVEMNLREKYDYLSKILPPNLRVPVLTLFLESDISKLNQAEDIEFVINKTYLDAKYSIYEQYIRKRFDEANSFKKGMDGPDFVLENEKGEKVSLATFRGKVVYLDFWYAACGPCHALFQTIKPVKEKFSENENVVFLSVSTDLKEVWKEALKKYQISGSHAFTEDKENNHPIIKEYKVRDYPTVCIIDKAGKIFMANPSKNPEKLIKQIEEALAA